MTHRMFSELSPEVRVSGSLLLAVDELLDIVRDVEIEGYHLNSEQLDKLRDAEAAFENAGGKFLRERDDE